MCVLRKRMLTLTLIPSKQLLLYTSLVWHSENTEFCLHLLLMFRIVCILKWDSGNRAVFCRGSAAARLLGLWVRIPQKALISVFCFSCVLRQVEASSTGRSFVQGVVSSMCVSLCMMKCKDDRLHSEWVGKRRSGRRKKERKNCFLCVVERNVFTSRYAGLNLKRYFGWTVPSDDFKERAVCVLCWCEFKHFSVAVKLDKTECSQGTEITFWKWSLRKLSRIRQM
jgi:hypothetical protein